MAYATLADARSQLKAQSNDDDAILLRGLDRASKRLERLWRGTFEPLRQTRPFPIRADQINSYDRLFFLDKWFLTLNSVTVYNTALTVGTNVEAYMNGYSPYQTLRLISTGDSWYTTWADSDYHPTVLVGADWGFRPYYLTEGWRDSQDSIQDAAGINATVTTVTVTDADGTDWENRTPRFSAGQLIRAGTEWMRVLDTDITLNTLTVRRGENGSTAAVHAKDVQLDVFYPPDDIRDVVARQAALMYERRGAYDTPLGDFAGAAYPHDLLAELKDTVQGYIDYVGP